MSSLDMEDALNTLHVCIKCYSLLNNFQMVGCTYLSLDKMLLL